MSLKSIIQNRRLLLSIAGIAFLSIVLVWNIGSTSIDVASFTVERGEFIVDLESKGEIQAVNSQAVSVPRSIRSNIQITRMAAEGTHVKKDDFLVQFDQTQATQKLEEKKNELQNAQAEMASTRATAASKMAELESALQTQEYSHEQARLRYEQMKYEAEAKRREQEINLRKAELALTQAEEKIASQKKIDEASIQKARLQIQRAELQLAQAEREFQSLTLKAPIDGLVVYKEIWGPSGRAKVKVGDTPWRGQALIEIPDLARMRVKTSINEVDVSRVAKGQQVRIKLDALPEPVFYGTVSQVATLASRKKNSSVKEFEVLVLIDGTDSRLKPGMSASVEIITDRVEDAVYVPLESVFEQEGETIVYLADSFKPVAVVVGQKNSDFVQILEGLEPGARVCLRDPTLPLEEIGAEEPKPINKKAKKKNSRGEGFMIIG